MPQGIMTAFRLTIGKKVQIHTDNCNQFLSACSVQLVERLSEHGPVVVDQVLITDFFRSFDAWSSCHSRMI